MRPNVLPSSLYVEVKSRPPHLFDKLTIGSRQWEHRYYVGGFRVSAKVYTNYFKLDVGPRWPLPRGRGVRARKTAILARKPLKGCDHEWEYHQDWEGDPDVPNGTHTISWLECLHCHEAKAPGPHDGMDDYFCDDY